MNTQNLYNDIPNTPEDLESVRIGSSVLEVVRRGPTKDRLSKRNQYDRVKGARSGWHVHKFGGSSFADPECYAFVADLINSFDGKSLIVVSAMSGITNLLYSVCARAAEGTDFADSADWSKLRTKILEVIALRLGDSLSRVKEVQRFSTDLVYLSNVLSLMHGATPADRELITSLVVGYGEIWSARLLTQIMRLDHHKSSAFMDARDVLVVDPNDDVDNTIEVCWDVTRSKLKKWFVNRKRCDVLIVTGFIARTLRDDLPTTLKRNGSDFSATIFSVLSKAHSVTVWKDVDGMYTSDPKKNPDAKFIPYQTFEEAEEASLRGAFVLQKDCIEPARCHNIPIFLRNCFNLSCPGTRIGPPVFEDGWSHNSEDETIFFMDESVAPSHWNEEVEYFNEDQFTVDETGLETCSTDIAPSDSLLSLGNADDSGSLFI
jgi:aspartokinase/homoserine dehydrogenase 1